MACYRDSFTFFTTTAAAVATTTAATTTTTTTTTTAAAAAAAPLFYKIWFSSRFRLQLYSLGPKCSS
jgi:hypothetical protein